MLLQGHSPPHHNSLVPEGGFLFLFLIYFIFGEEGGGPNPSRLQCKYLHTLLRTKGLGVVVEVGGGWDEGLFTLKSLHPGNGIIYSQ